MNENSEKFPYEVDVLMITYNHQDYISEAINSVINQITNFNFRLLIFNDCSYDLTEEKILKCLNHKNDRLSIIYENNVENLGFSLNGLKSLSKAKSKYIAFCEGDDYWIDSNKLQKQVDFLNENNNYVLCASNSRILRNSILLDEDKSISYLKDKTLNFSNLISDFTYNQIPTATTLFRRSVLDVVDFNFVKKCMFGDWPLLLEISRVGKIYFFKDFFSVYRINEKGAHSGLNSKEQKLAIIDFYKNVKFKYQEVSLLCDEQVSKVLDEYGDYIANDLTKFYQGKIISQAKYLNSRSYILDNISFVELFKLFVFKLKFLITNT